MAVLPAELERLIAAALGPPISGVTPLGGGFGASLLRVSVGGASYALKWAVGGRPAAMIAAEAHGLRALAATGAIRVPAVVARFGQSAPGSGWEPASQSATMADRYAEAPASSVVGHQSSPGAALLTEWVDGAGAHLDMAALGEQLAALHRHSAAAYGLDVDNYIGGTPQANGWRAAWPDFFRVRRLEPQIALAATAGLLAPARRRALERLSARLDDLLGLSDPPSLIHGDLWGGNVVAGPGGMPALIDPAVSYSHREAELAFTELFGGFSSRFYAAYQAAWPLDPGYRARRPIYNLYHGLNHLNLFGSGYLSMVDDLLSQIGL